MGEQGKSTTTKRAKKSAKYDAKYDAKDTASWPNTRLSGAHRIGWHASADTKHHNCDYPLCGLVQAKPTFCPPASKQSTQAPPRSSMPPPPARARTLPARAVKSPPQAATASRTVDLADGPPLPNSEERPPSERAKAKRPAAQAADAASAVSDSSTSNASAKGGRCKIFCMDCYEANGTRCMNFHPACWNAWHGLEQD